MAVTVDQFGKALVTSGLISADEVKSLWSTISPDARPKQGDGFAKLLVDQGKLTKFQADELLAGRTTPLVMGDYVLIAKIGEGGMGQVYKAQHKRMNRSVALKVMSAAAMQDEAAIKRFQREVHAAAKLEHPNIVTAYDSGEAGAVKYLVMQFVDGGDLSSLIKKNGPLEIERAVGYVVQAAQGLAFAHGEGVIHRDIKPANLLLDKKGVVKILDMGLARIESGDDGLTATEQVMGTVDYMSPEQAAQTKGVDGRADVYSLGCTLWFLLTGKKAYEADTMIARLMAHRDAPLPSLVQVRDDAPWPLEQALHKMIAKTPQDRYQSMDEVVAALAPFGPSGAAVGMGSSIGMGGGPQNAELASFLKTVGPGGKPQAKPAPSATNVGVEATAQFVSAEVSTDPKSEILPAPRSAANPQAKGAVVKGKKPPVALIAGGIGGLALLVALGLWLIIRDKDGNEVARIQATDGTKVQVAPGNTIEVRDDAAAPTPKIPSSIPPVVASQTTGAAPSLLTTRWPLSPSKPADIVWLQGLQATLTLRTGPATDLVLKPTDAPPTGAATIVGAAFDRDSGAAVTDDVLKRLATLVDLESLSLMLGETAPATKQGLPQLATLVHLRHLGLGRIGPPATDPAFLGALTELESLALQYASFTGWEPVVGRLPLLRDLKIHGVDDAQLEQLRPVPRLTTLTLSGYTPGRAQRDAAAKRFADLAPWCRITLHDDKVDKNRVVIEPTAPPPPSVAAPGGTWTIVSSEARDRLAQLARNSSNSFISHDGLTLGGHSLTTDRDVVLATRERVGDPWPTPVNLGPVVNIAGGLNGGEDTLPTISLDRTTLVFFSKRPPKEGLFSTVRGDAAQPFAPPVRLGDAINFPRDGRSWYPGLSADGQWLTFGRMDNARKTSGYVARRAGPGAEFTAAQPMGPAIDALGDLRSSSITNDGLTLVVVAAQTGVPKEPKTLWTATRRSTEAPFENPVPLGPQFGGENLIATLSGDGRTIWAVRDDEVLQAVRAAPTAAIPLGNSPGAKSADVVYLDDLPEKSYFGLQGIIAKPGRNPNDAAESSRIFPGTLLVHALHVHPDSAGLDKDKNAKSTLPPHQSIARVVYELDGQYASFQSGFRLRASSNGSHQAEVWGDGRRLWESGSPLPKHPADVTADVDVRGVCELTLFIWTDEDRSHVLLTEPRLTPAASAAPSEPRTSVSGTTAAPQPAIFPFDAAAARKHQEAWAAHLGVPVEFTNDVGMKFRFIPPGEFQMGLGPEVADEEVRRLTGMTNDRDLEKFNACRAAHLVRITRPFYMEVEEVTTGRFQEVFGELRPNMTDGPEKPLEHYVAWPDAIAFCNKLSEREGKRPAYRIEGVQITPIDGADGYRLPTEAQWEYACRAGTNTLWYFGNEGSPDGKTFKTQCVAPNPFGLTGLYGGAYEWCWDATNNNFDPYPAAPPGGRVDPREDVGTMRIKRGGSGNDGGGASRISINSFARNKGGGAPYGPDTSPYSGFGRVVLPIATSASQPAAPKGDEAGGLTQIELLTSPDYEWTEPENLGPTVNGPDGQSLSSLTGDELLVYYHRKGGADGQQDELWEATRTSRDVPFDNPRLVMLGNGVYLSGDGLTRVKGVRTLSMWQRSSLDRGFGPQTLLNFELGSYARFPTLSPDGLALVFSLKADQEERFELWMSRRASRDVDFGPPTKLGPVVNDGGSVNSGVILSDGQTLLYRRNKKLYLSVTDAAGAPSARELPDHPFAFDGWGEQNVWIAPDGRTAYFSAERPGGLGGTDMYVTRRVPKRG